jgi:glutaredoxin
MKYAFLLIGLICGIFWSQIFETVSPYINGQIPTAKPSQAELKRKIVSVSTPTIEPVKQPIAENSKNVLMYSTSWCGYCKKALEHFIKNKISFLEYDIEKDDRANRMHDILGGGGVPLIIYNGKMMRGFSESKFISLHR